jgi:hypothetical protein
VKGLHATSITDPNIMFKFATLAAVAAVLVAGPAAAAESIHVTTVGKSPAQVKAEIQTAAVKLCNAEVGDSILSYYLQTPCVKATVKAAVAQSADPALQVASR